MYGTLKPCIWILFTNTFIDSLVGADSLVTCTNPNRQQPIIPYLWCTQLETCRARPTSTRYFLNPRVDGGKKNRLGHRFWRLRPRADEKQAEKQKRIFPHRPLSAQVQCQDDWPPTHTCIIYSRAHRWARSRAITPNNHVRRHTYSLTYNKREQRNTTTCLCFCNNISRPPHRQRG